jgi:ribosomal protein S18 acetylase RimI-like enzyme
VIVIRKAHPEDWTGAARVNVRSWQFTYRGVIPDQFLDALVPEEWAGWRESFYAEPPAHALGLVAADHGIRGYCDIGRSRSRTDGVTGEVFAIYVDPDHIGTGVGSRLFIAAMAGLRQLGHARVELWVLDSNERARKFYERHGWELAPDVKTETIGGVDLDEVRYIREL